MNRNSNALAAAIAATLGAGVAQAATTTVTLTQWATYSNNGTAGSNANITSSTATWQYDDVAGTITQTGGTLNARFTTAPTSTLFRQTTTGLVIGNSGAASATTFSCVEGNFGTGVGASICGNYNFGGDFVDDSTLAYSGSSVTRTIGGDDVVIGAAQSLADLNGIAVLSSVGTTLQLTNRSCIAQCTTLPAGAYNKGYLMTFQLPTPAVVADTGTTHFNTPVVLDVLANDTNLPGSVTVSISTPPDNGGSVVVTDDGATASSVCTQPCTAAPANIRVKLTPSAIAGTATYTENFVYTVASVGTAAVAVTVNNVVPVAGDTTNSISTVGLAPASTSTTVNAGTLAGNNLGDPATVITKTDGATGTVGLSGNVLTYTPNATFFTGSDTFTYTIKDGDLETDTGTVTVNIPNATPSLADAAAETDEGTAVDVDLADSLDSPGNGSLAQHAFYLGPVVTALGNGNPANGTCDVSGTVLTYTPNAGFTGTDTCAVAVEDGDGSVDAATVTITVNAVNTFTSTGLREDDGGSSADWLILSLLGGSALLRRRRRAS